MTVFSIVLQSLLIAYYVFSGSAKIAGVKYWVDIFNNLRIPQWFRVITGTVQLVGAVVLVRGYWDADVIAWGAIWLGITMIGALLVHLRVKDAFGKTMQPVVFLLLLIVLTILNAGGLTV
ncbi:DoxX-like family protein [Cohnella sp. OV330]|uniref:DoxX family protein n=1 Tax=Cohnella sp. OV330 TaxID=1855288 RepID=UPI0008EFFCF7|nr:DoxX family protein [Cohnella sp. OV330]SFB52133.1 DoxX-like family protein [Cohnella sp. OV330]